MAEPELPGGSSTGATTRLVGSVHLWWSFVRPKSFGKILPPWARWALPPVIFVATLVPVLTVNPQSFDQVTEYLPLAALGIGYSFVRMVFAYALSLGFGLIYGYYAATHRTGERILLPILDILQSVPILGFFPLVLVLFIDLIPSPIGANLAAIFLIFTSMAWNLAFGVYEEVKNIPTDLREATAAYGAKGQLRWRVLILPATVNRLVYNSVLSWTAGWFYLVSAEIVSTATGALPLPGIGSFLAVAAALNPPNYSALIAGMSLLAVLIIVMDIFVWRPATRWAERFRYDTSPSGEEVVETPGRPAQAVGRAVRVVTRGVARTARGSYAVLRAPFEGLITRTRTPAAPPPASPRMRVAGRYLILGSVLVAVWLLLIYIIVSVYNVFTHPPPTPEELALIAQLPEALASSVARLLAAYLLCLAIALPLAIYLARHSRASRYGLPVVEVVASFPATAFFPLIVVALAPVVGDQFTAILLLMTGMVWYIFFNALSGVRQLPPDLDEAARSYGVRKTEYYRRVLLPAMVPALITGSITAVGGGWNALIVAEYLANPIHPSQPLFQVLGLGQMIDIGTFMNQPAVLAAALLTLVLVVVAINELIWKPLYRRTSQRYRYD